MAQPSKEGTNLFGSGDGSTLFGSGQTTIQAIPIAESPFATKQFDSAPKFQSPAFGSLGSTASPFSTIPLSSTFTTTSQSFTGVFNTNPSKSPVNIAGAHTSSTNGMDILVFKLSNCILF